MKRLKTVLTLASLWLLLGSLAQAGTVHYYYTDPQDTPLVKTDASGNVIARYDYAPYGASVASLGSPPNGPGYTGHVNDPETGLVYMQARYYDPAVGRFLSVDPVTPSAGNSFNFNRYVYVNNNPLVRIDRDGRQASDDSAIAPCGDCIRPPTAVLDGAAQVLDFVDEATTAYPGGGLEHAAAIPLIAGLKEASAATKVARLSEAANALKEATAAERAKTIASAMSPRTQRAVTIAVTDTKEGLRVVSSSEGKLRPAAQAALNDGEVAAKGVSGTHAEVNGINAAREMGLTPTGTAASRPICASCAQTLQQNGLPPLSPLKNAQ